MKATGIVRRIDGLGRIVIPREIRKQLGISNGDSIEIFIDRGVIILKKYDTAVGLDELVRKLDNEFLNVKSDIDSETANRIYEHINALREILKNMDKE